MTGSAPPASGPLRIESFGLGDPRVREFARMPWRLYRGDPCWTPPLDAELLGSRVLRLDGLLTSAHPYHRHAEVTHFLARRGGSVVGRVSAAVNRRFNEHYSSSIGFFGFFEVVDDEQAAVALLDSAREWLAARGMTVMRGPGQYSNATHERQGILIDGFEHPPTVELTHNPAYYPRLLESWGLAKVKDYHAYLVDLSHPLEPRVRRLAAEVRQRGRFLTRPVDMRDLRRDVRTLVGVYNDAWSANWGFLPVTEGEADALADSLEPVVDADLVRFAFDGDEPIAVLGAIPDPYWALRPRWRWYGESDAVRLARLMTTRRRIPRLRLMMFGIRPGHRRTGVDALLFEETYDRAVAHGYTTCEASMLLEDNDLILRAASALGGERYKTWRIYEAPIA